MPLRTARVATEYAGRRLAVGDRFEVEPNHVGILLAVGHIEPVRGEPGYMARDMTADAPSGYQTRDMQAQPPRRRGRPPKVGTQ